MAVQEDLIIDQGSDVSVQLNLANTDGSAKDLTAHTVSAKMKKTYNSPDSDTTDFTTALSLPITAGICTLSLTNTQTGALKAGRYVYDVEISYVDSDSSTVVERILEGRIEVTPSVTK